MFGPDAFHRAKELGCFIDAEQSVLFPGNCTRALDVVVNFFTSTRSAHCRVHRAAANLATRSGSFMREMPAGSLSAADVAMRLVHNPATLSTYPGMSDVVFCAAYSKLQTCLDDGCSDEPDFLAALMGLRRVALHHDSVPNVSALLLHHTD